MFVPWCLRRSFPARDGFGVADHCPRKHPVRVDDRPFDRVRRAMIRWGWRLDSALQLVGRSGRAMVFPKAVQIYGKFR